MRENNLIALALLGVIIGASGLGFGAYSTMQVQTGAIKGEDGDDGDDGKDGSDAPIGEEPGNIYYCSSQPEIEDALDIISTGHGTLIITENITLSSIINIDDGGHYIIQGAGPITLNRNASDETFSVTNVQSLTLKDLIIDASNITSSTTSGIEVIEGNDNPVYIQNIQIGGDDKGRGIYVNSENVWIQNCIIKDFSCGIYLDSSSAYCHILDNSILEMNPSSGRSYGIHLMYSEFNTIRGNVVKNINATGTSGHAQGIYLAYSDSNTISGNWINNIGPTGAGTARGIILDNSHHNIVTDNRFDTIASASANADGIVVGMGNYNTFTGNTISNLQAPSSYGISIQGGNYNAVVGNTLYNCGSGIFDSGTGNEVDHNAID